MDALAEITEAFDATFEPPAALRGPVTCTVEGVLLPEDLRDYLDEHGKLTTTRKADEKDIRHLREKHHSVARLRAEDIPQSVIATITGYTESYLSVLLRSPAMIELIEHYRAPGNLAARQIGEQLRRVAGMSVERLEEKILADGLTPSELTAVAKLGYDRSGHGPQSTIHAVTEHHIIDHAEIARRHKQARERDADLIVHPEAVREALPQLPRPEENDDAAAT